MDCRSRPQLSFAKGLIEEEAGSLWDPWMRQVDPLLADREPYRCAPNCFAEIASAHYVR
jgi:hypothetical protein